MNRAAGIVQGGMSQVQSLAQQATFAVDDFFAAFSTGGVSSGIRGAANNLTLIASQIGGIKVQLLAIAGLSAAQLIARQFEKTADSIDRADKSLGEFQARLQRRSAIPGQQRSATENIRDIMGERSVGGAFRSREEGRLRLLDLQTQLRAEEKRIGDLQQVQSSVVTEEAATAVRDEIAERKKVVIEIKREIREQKTLNEAITRQLQLLQERYGDRFGGTGGSGLGGGLSRRAAARAGIADIDEEIAALQNNLRPSLSMADMFRMMPGLNARGSVGAISAINAAQIGPQNARDSGVELQRQSLQQLRRIRELEEKKKGLLEVVGL